jgi:arginine deiminase
MSKPEQDFKINNTSEVGLLRALLIHSPDSGLGKVSPAKAQDWLFEDIVHLHTIRKKEYDYYVKVLMYFLDPQIIKGKAADIDKPESNRAFYKPGDKDFHNSLKVIEIQNLLADILVEPGVRQQVVAAVCGMENCIYAIQQELVAMHPANLAKVLISGFMDDGRMIFAPLPNFIFSRDVGVVIHQHILISKPAKKARARESLLMRYIFFNHQLFERYRDNIIEIPESIEQILETEDDRCERTTLECGDVMVIAPGHVLIGCSERTSVLGANAAIKKLFDLNVVTKVTVIKIQQKRNFMHLDTVFTQVKRNVWVLLRSLFDSNTASAHEPASHINDLKTAEKPQIVQFTRGQVNTPRFFNHVEDLLDDISRNDLHSTQPTRFVYSGDGNFPDDVREQWTDSCNLLTLKEGVALAYDRNDKTLEAFSKMGFNTIPVTELLKKLESGELSVETLTDTIIVMPSAELSRARGGFHCMSMPLLRDEIQ